MKHETVYFVSYPKAGRTWLRIMIALCFENAPLEVAVEATENLHLGGNMPLLVFEHGNYLDPKNFHTFFKSISRKRVSILFRDPRDIVVSSYFQESLRNGRYKTGGLLDFIHDPIFGVHSIVRYYNEALTYIHSPSIVSYEDLHSDPAKVLRILFSDLGVTMPQHRIMNSVARTKFDILQLEARTSDNFRLAPTDESNPESQKFRKGKVGGFVNYLSLSSQAFINDAVCELDPRYRVPNTPLQ